MSINRMILTFFADFFASNFDVKLFDSADKLPTTFLIQHTILWAACLCILMNADTFNMQMRMQFYVSERLSEPPDALIIFPSVKKKIFFSFQSQ